jgi:hypothetical protein
MVFAEDQDAVGEFSSGGADEAFGVAVRSRASRWDLHGLDAGAGENDVERGGELAGGSKKSGSAKSTGSISPRTSCAQKRDEARRMLRRSTDLGMPRLTTRTATPDWSEPRGVVATARRRQLVRTGSAGGPEVRRSE